MIEPTIHLSVCAKTDTGRTRDHNEDTFLVADLTRGTTEFLEGSEAVVGTRGTLFLVADGMGGAAAGEIASAMAADAIFRHLISTWTQEAETSGELFTQRLREAVELANARIHEYAREHPDVRGMGTTATVAGLIGPRLYLAQVGDSRAYIVRNGQAVQLTKDQSLMQRLIDAGELTEEEAAQSERRNIILQALGPDARVRVDVTYQDLARGDLLIICSDGLSGQVKREEIGELAARHPDVRDLADALIAMANDRGGPDNITVVAVRFEGDGLPLAAEETDVGYHIYPFPGKETSGENPVPPAAVSSPPPAPEVRRSGSPLTMATLGVGLLALLALLFWLLAGR